MHIHIILNLVEEIENFFCFDLLEGVEDETYRQEKICDGRQHIATNCEKTIVYYLIQTWDWIPEIPDISHKTMLVVLAVAGVAARAVH